MRKPFTMPLGMMRYAIPIGWLALLVGGNFGNALAAQNDFIYWQQSNPDATARANHENWHDLLSHYVEIDKDGVNRFAYKAVTPVVKARLDAYIAGLEKIAVTEFAAAEQMAYWINLYNAVTVQVVLDHYPVDSIRDISFGLASWLKKGPWGEKLTTVEGMELSLDDIEHRILRPIFADNRVHYALNCASIGCPNLQPLAYTRDNLEQLLERAAHDYINHPRGVRFAGDKLIVSSIFDWYAEDFGANQRQVIEHFHRYAESRLRQRLQQVNYIDDFFYDWSLNGS